MSKKDKKSKKTKKHVQVPLAELERVRLQLAGYANDVMHVTFTYEGRTYKGVAFQEATQEAPS